MAFHDRVVRACDRRSAAPARASTASATARPKYLELEHGAEGVRLMRAIKHALDPDDIFNPGKVADAT